MIWVNVPGPGGGRFIGKCDDLAEYDRIVAVRDHVLDGQRATISGLSDRDNLFVEFALDQPWRPPPIRLTMEDHAAADRIAAFGFHVFEGGLYRAMLAEPGVLVLDRTFTASPPPVWHGGSWPEEAATVRRPKVQA